MMSSKNTFWSVELNRIEEAFWKRGETFSNKIVENLVIVDLIYTNTLVSSGGGLNTSAAWDLSPGVCTTFTTGSA